MQFFISYLALPVGGLVTFVACFMFLLRSEILLVIRADRYLVLTRGRPGKGRYRVLEKGVHFRVPFWETIVGEAPRGVRIYEWEFGDTVVWYSKGESYIRQIPAYVLSIRVVFTNNPRTIQRIACGELTPLLHLQQSVRAAVIQPGRKPLQPELAVHAVEDWFQLHSANHGYIVESVCTYKERT